MQRIPVIFSRSMHPVSLAIRAFTWSHWSHCGAITEDGANVIESRGGIGVIVTPLHAFKGEHPEWRVAEMPVVNRSKAYEHLRAEIGKPYDMTGVISIATRRNWEESDSWFCSELLAHASGVFRRDSIKRITPEDIWRVCRD